MMKLVEMITDRDLDRILECLANYPSEITISELWDEKFERAQIIGQQEAPPDLVTIHSKIRCQDDGEHHIKGELTIVYPSEANIDEGKISILAPLGVALLGARVGDVVFWQGRDGRKKNIRIDSLDYQPEANGHWHL